MTSASAGPMIFLAALLALLLGAAWLLGMPPWPLLVGAAAGLAFGFARLSSAPAVGIESEAAIPGPAPEAMRLRQIVDSLPDPMLLLRDGRVDLANRAAQGLLGEWVEGQDVRLGLRHPAAVERIARPPAPGGAAEQTEIIGIGDPNRPWLMTVATLEDGSNLVHFSDRSEAAAAEKMRVDFVANASHELKTPLATILGFVETLQDDKAANDRKTRLRFLEIMRAEAKRMQQLIEDLLSLSRIEADRYRLPSDNVDLIAVVEEVRDGCNQLFLDRKSRMAIETEADSPLVLGDRGQLLQLLRNLVVNALKYGREGEAVMVRIEDGGERMVRLSVVDRGEGIAPEHLPRLTERFYRIDTGRSRAAGGTGLGLAIVKHIVGRHRGRLEIRSRQGEGTTVEVLLPRAERPLS